MAKPMLSVSLLGDLGTQVVIATSVSTVLLLAI